MSLFTQGLQRLASLYPCSLITGVVASDLKGLCQMSLQGPVSWSTSPGMERVVRLGWRSIVAQVGGRNRGLGQPGHAHPSCDRESIRWKNGTTAYKGNKEPRRRGIFICPSTHSEGRRFIMDRYGIAFFSPLLNGAACAGWGWGRQCGFVGTITRKQDGRHIVSGQKTLL